MPTRLRLTPLSIDSNQCLRPSTPCWHSKALGKASTADTNRGDCMANAQEKIDQLLSTMSGGSEADRLKMLLHYGDLSEEFADFDFNNYSTNPLRRPEKMSLPVFAILFKIKTGGASGRCVNRWRLSTACASGLRLWSTDAP